MSREALIQAIVTLEWEMFTHTRSAGGRASCQDDRQTFEIMRTSQMKAWQEDTLRSYLQDLRQAVQDGRNLVQEKYAWMMASTHPEEFALLAPLLPRQSEEKKALVEQILSIQMAALEAMRPVYPHVLSAMRILRTSEDTPEATSLETYQRGELYTYSPSTLDCYLRQLRSMRDYGKTILEETSRQYGYASLDALELALAGRR